MREPISLPETRSARSRHLHPSRRPTRRSSGRAYGAPLTFNVGLHKNHISSKVRACEADAIFYATLEWVDWFNNRRLLEPIGNIPPVEIEMAYYRQMEESAEAE